MTLAVPAPAQTVRLGSEFRINSYTLNYQVRPRIARDPDGNFLVVWASYGQDGSKTGVYGRRFDASGTHDNQFRANTYTGSYQDYPAVAVDASRTFVVVWHSYRQDGSYYGVYAQRYGTQANPQGSEFRVNSQTSYDQRAPEVVKNGSGKFVVAWVDEDDGSGDGVFVRRYDQSGAPLGSIFRANTYTNFGQSYPSMAKDGSGNFTIVWMSYGQDGSDLGVYGQRFLENGTKTGGEFRANTYTTGAQLLPQIAENNSGAFVVVWQSAQDGSGFGIYAQRYNGSGTKVGGEFLVNTYTTGDQIAPAVALDSDGKFVIVWQSFGQDASMEGVYGQRYNSNGTPRGLEFMVNTYTSNSQRRPAVAIDNSGSFVAVWESFGQDGSQDGIYGQRFSTSDCAALTVAAPVNQLGCSGGSVLFGATASGTGPFTYQWKKGSVPLDDGPFISGSKTKTLTINNIMPIDEGNYSCEVTDFCLPAASATSASAALTYHAEESVGRVDQLTVQKVNGGTAIQFNWGTAVNASDYVIVEDTEPDGAFVPVTGSSPDGATGLTIPLTPVTTYYLAAGRNATCGIGPRK